MSKFYPVVGRGHFLTTDFGEIVKAIFLHLS